MSDIILELRVPTMCYDIAGKCYTQSTMEEAADYIEKLEAKLAAAESQPAVPEWRPIETAPKNRTPMIVVCGVFAPGCITDPWCVWWQGGEWARWPHRKPPTHWMPLPEPPAGDKP